MDEWMLSPTLADVGAHEFVIQLDDGKTNSTEIFEIVVSDDLIAPSSALILPDINMTAITDDELVFNLDDYFSHPLSTLSYSVDLF